MNALGRRPSRLAREVNEQLSRPRSCCPAAVATAAALAACQPPHRITTRDFCRSSGPCHAEPSSSSFGFRSGPRNAAAAPSYPPRGRPSMPPGSGSGLGSRSGSGSGSGMGSGSGSGMGSGSRFGLARPSAGASPQAAYQVGRAGPSAPKRNPMRTAIRQVEEDTSQSKWPANYTIPYSTVQLAQNSGSLSPPQRLNDLLAGLDLDRVVVHLVSADPPVVKVFDKELLAAREKQAEAQLAAQKRFESDTRIVTVSWACADGDVAHKVQQARRHLSDGDRVELVFAVKGAAHKDKTTQERKDEIVRAFAEGIADIGIPGRNDTVKGKGLSSFWRPKNEIKSARISEIKEHLTDQQKDRNERFEKRRQKAEERRIKAEEERRMAEQRLKDVMAGKAQ